MAMLERQWAVFVKKESVPNTYEAPNTSTDFLPTSQPQITLNTKETTRNHHLAGYGEAAKSFVGRSVQVTFNTDMTADFDTTDPGTAPKYGRLLEITNCIENIVADTKIEYTLTPNIDGPSNSLLIYLAGHFFKIAGARANIQLNTNAGDMGVWALTITGLCLAVDQFVADGSYVSPSYTPGDYLKFQNAATVLSWNGGSYSSFIINNYNLDFGVSLAERNDAGQPNGLKAMFIDNVIPTIGIDPESVALSAFNPFLGLLSNRIYDLSTSFINDAGTRKMTVTLEDLQLNQADPNSARSGIRAWALNLKATQSAMKFTFENVTP